MAEKILAKDATVGSIYLTRGGRQFDSEEREQLWGFYPVKVLRKVNDDRGELKKVIVSTMWNTEVDLAPDYPLEITDLKKLPDNYDPTLLTGKKISCDDEAPPEYVEKLKRLDKKEPTTTDVPTKREAKNKDLIAELKNGTMSVKELAVKFGKSYTNMYISITNLKKKGFTIQKIKKGVFKIVE